MARSQTPRKRRKSQGVTMVDVARRADVSPSTVSLFLRRPDAVSAKAGDAVKAAIRDLDYVPNFMAGGLAAATSRVVAVIVPSVRNAFFAETVAALQRDLGQARLQILLGHTEYDPAVEEDLVRTALSWAPAALVIAGTTHSETTQQLLEGARVPIVQVWELGGHQPVDMAVGFHHEEVGAAAARHLAARGCRSLVFFSGRTHQDRRAARRAAGFMAAGRELGLDVRHLSHPAPASTELGGILFNRLLKEKRDEREVGIGCSNDFLALGLIFEAQRHQIAIPQDFAVIGFGDLEFSSSCNPALSTIRPFGDLIGSEAARLITSSLGDDVERQPVTIDTGFGIVQRQTS